VANVERRAHVVWEGDLMGGNGSLSEEDSGVLREAAVTFTSRTGRPEAKTSPEELIASADVTCYAMALSNTLAEQDAPPVRLKVDAVCTPDDEQLKITTVDIEVRGEVSGLDEEEFRTSSAVRRRRPGASRDTRASPGPSPRELLLAQQGHAHAHRGDILRPARSTAPPPARGARRASKPFPVRTPFDPPTFYIVAFYRRPALTRAPSTISRKAYDNYRL
jgi:lipoyl-dependent peroxiredoxin